MISEGVQTILDLGFNGVMLAGIIVLWGHILTLNKEIKRLNKQLEDYHAEVVKQRRQFNIHDIINTSD